MTMRLIALFVAIALITHGSNCWDLNMDEARMMAKCLYGECRGIESTEEKAAVAWTILNRVDDERFPDTIPEVIGQPCQFSGYSFNNPVDDELLDLSMDVIVRWQREKHGESNIGRVLPKEYVYFVGRAGRNWFGTDWPVSSAWDWSLDNPYQEEEENVDDPICLDEHDEPADAADRNNARLRCLYRGFDDGVVD